MEEAKEAQFQITHHFKAAWAGYCRLDDARVAEMCVVRKPKYPHLPSAQPRHNIKPQGSSGIGLI